MGPDGRCMNVGAQTWTGYPRHERIKRRSWEDAELSIKVCKQFTVASDPPNCSTTTKSLGIRCCVPRTTLASTKVPVMHIKPLLTSPEAWDVLEVLVLRVGHSLHLTHRPPHLHLALVARLCGAESRIRQWVTACRMRMPHQQPCEALHLPLTFSLLTSPYPCIHGEGI